MTIEAFQNCLAFTWRPENDGQSLHLTPHDPGLDTAWGVTIHTYTAWEKAHGGSSPTVDDLSHAAKDDLADLIHAWYWNTVQGDHLPRGIDLMVFDCGFVSGPALSVKLLQQALGFGGIDVDGRLGPVTLCATRIRPAFLLVADLQTVHENHYRHAPSFHDFGHGLLRRCDDRRRLAVDMVTRNRS